jgi:DNA replication and repair protein RecF
MPLTLLEVADFRPFLHTRIDPDPRLNLIIGRNASGKTSLLEAIYVLGTGRSFRTTHLDQLIRQSTSSFLVSGIYQDADLGQTRLAIQRDQGLTQISAGGTKQSSASALARLLPLQVISPDSHFQFFTQTRHRRGILDWGVFHVEPDFYTQWLRYQRSLSQRNAALKRHQDPQACFAWDPELIEAGELLHAYRSVFLQEWTPRLQRYCGYLLGIDDVDIVLKQGWDPNTTFAQTLLRDRSRDFQKATTHSGPHRADISLHLQKQPARISASHGQQKLLAIALRLAQLELFSEKTSRHCVVLIDDLGAELDLNHRRLLMDVLRGLPLQVFVTATEVDHIDTRGWASYKVFHVEHGQMHHGEYDMQTGENKTKKC